MAQISVTSLALQGVNKTGILKPDENGWYTVILGALNFPNSTGAIYNVDPARALLSGDSQFARKLRKGQLTGELGHPRREFGMDDNTYLRRLLDVREDKESHSIRKVVIDTTAKDKNGRPFIAFKGEVKPSGPYGHILKEKFSDPDQNVCFSIRSFTQDRYFNGRIEKNLSAIVTWDYVTEPGLSVAEKYNAPGLESYCDMTMADKEISTLIDQQKEDGLESSPVTEIAKDILKSLRKPTITDIREGRPAYMRW